LVTVLAVGMGLSLFGVGLVLVAVALGIAELSAWISTKRLWWVFDAPVKPTAQQLPGGTSLMQRTWGWFVAARTWKRLAHGLCLTLLAPLSLVVVVLTWAIAIAVLTWPVYSPVIPASTDLLLLPGNNATRVGAVLVGLGLLFIAAAADHGNMRGREKAYSETFQGMVRTWAMLVLNKEIELTEETLHRAFHQLMHGIFS